VLVKEENQLICNTCKSIPAIVKNNIIVYKGSNQKTDIFDKKAVNYLGQMYSTYTRNTFIDDLNKFNLNNIDFLNKKVGITTKFWWEKYIGKIKDKNVLEFGCGVNYLVPYWLLTKNNVVAFDVCKEAVFLLKDIVKRLNLPDKSLQLYVGDASLINFDKKFDIININNVLHHINDIRGILSKLKKMLNKNGKILIVEPNYYYPFRWFIETDIFGKFNFVKKYFEKNYLIEKNEKAIKFKELKQLIKDMNFSTGVNVGDPNYLGYATIYFLDKFPRLVNLIYYTDKYLFSKIIPKVIAPFQYFIISQK
jgi:SAM-dependent methyltransferase